MPHYVSSNQFAKCRNAHEHGVERPTTGWDEKDEDVGDLRCATVDCFRRHIPCEVAGGIPAFQLDSCCAIALASPGAARAAKTGTTGGHYGWPPAVREGAGETAGSARGGAAADPVAIVAIAGIAGELLHVPEDSYSAIDALR